MSKNHHNRQGVNEPIIGDNLALVMNRVLKAKEALDGVPAYLFDIVLLNGTLIGQIDLRLEHTQSLIMYGGQIGYGINKPYRGNGYAAQACILIREVALEVGYSELWITCNPDNVGSIRTCEKIGAQFVEQVEVPFGSELWFRGDREKIRYLWTLV